MIVQQDSDKLFLEVKKSNIPEAGEGLFAKTFFFKKQILAEYRGQVISSEHCYHQKFLFEDKMVYIDSDYSVLGRSIAAKANDIVIFQPQKVGSKEWERWLAEKRFPHYPGLKHNAKIEVMGKCKAMLVAQRDIMQGEQIYVDYGFNYWLFFHQHGFKRS